MKAWDYRLVLRSTSAYPHSQPMLLHMSHVCLLITHTTLAMHLFVWSV